MPSAPSEAQWSLWAHTPDDTFVAHPERGSPHSRGVAVDVTLETAAGVRLDMGGPVDELTENARHDAPGITPDSVPTGSFSSAS